MPSLIEGTASAARSTVVERNALFDRLSDAGGVVLVCSPAGSGKTVLVRSWLESAQRQDRAAWVSVERGERDAQRFWRTVTDALAGAVDGVQRIGPAPTFRADAAVDRLLDDLETLPDPVILVIDDLHELRAAEAVTLLERFLDRRPAGLLVVLATREDPDLGLHRLRVRGELTELRASDLRFSADEATELLRSAGVTLSAEGRASLYDRTEGWAAGLRLAAISLAHHPDPERFVAEFSGSERTVAGYLLAEVLERQPTEVRDLLLRTSVLDRVCGPLAEALTGDAGCERRLQELEDANAFVTALDVSRSWFRYHHLFADLLRLELRRTAPDDIADLHRAAAVWYRRNGYVLEAIRHAQAAGDWALASELLVDNDFDLTFDGRAGAVRELLRAIPDDVAAADPELSLVFATSRLLEGEWAEAAKHLDFAEGRADAVADTRRPRFDAMAALLRLVIARWGGDVEAAVDALPRAEAAVAAQPAGGRALSVELRAVALQNLGVAELWSSRLDEAREHLEAALDLARQARRPWLEISPLGHLGLAVPWSGASLAEGLRLSEEGVRLADAHGWGDDPVILTALATGARALLWFGRLDEAEDWIGRATRTLQPEGEPGSELIVHHDRGLLACARNRLEEACDAFRAAERMERLLAGGHAFAVASRARLARTQVGLGRIMDARRLVGEADEDARDTADMRMAAAVLHLAEDAPERALDVLGPVVEGRAPAMHRASATTEGHLLRALAQASLGDEPAAEAALEQALEAAEPEGILLPFLLVPVRHLVDGSPQHRTAHSTLRQTVLDVLAGSHPGPTDEGAAANVDLSQAELRVLRYLPSNLKAPEIAAELFVSTNTVRTHLRHIYAKLDAHGRTEAVDRARQLGLLAPSRRRR